MRLSSSQNRQKRKRPVKFHLMIALGLLMAGIFAFRGAQSFLAPGFGVPELYNLGGLAIAAALMFQGVQGFMADRKARKEATV